MRRICLLLGLLALISCAAAPADRDGGIGGTGAPTQTEAL